MKFLVVQVVAVAGMAMMTGTPAGAQVPSQGDLHYVREAMETNDGEIAAARLALERSDSDDVKLLARFLIHDREVMNAQMRPLAGDLNVRVGEGQTSPDQKQLADELAALTGEAFDRQYIAAMVQGNQKALKDTKKEAAQSQFPLVKNAAQTVVFVLQQHLEMAQNVAQAHHVTVEAP
jgi:putative membrane protein